VNQDKAIGEKFEKDTGIKIQYVAVTTDDVTKRAVTAPNSFDLIDTEYFSLKKIVPTGNLKGIDVKKIKNADKITSCSPPVRSPARRWATRAPPPRR
jgi:putative spermidine/putrescine transport system substrate-binding protein